MHGKNRLMRPEADSPLPAMKWPAVRSCNRQAGEGPPTPRRWRASSPPLYYGEGWWRLAVLRRALVVFSHAPSLDRPNLPENWHGRQVTLLHRAVLETAALLVGHVRKNGGAGRLRSVSSALRARRAAISTTTPKWTRRRDLHPRIPALQAGPFAARARRGTQQFQVARRRKISPASARDD